jgi:coproporphyrinogen III oxidase
VGYARRDRQFRPLYVLLVVDQPEPGSAEAKLAEYLKPREWL